ncbi:MAG: hypothetical protein A2X56_03465 [Nitrospirae bacterium GWC2_57_13]|jgi:hypothetical protein|nr:MAG: hypothetical protein A2X56_03465 [Nitrospirae bacterium GWC2_57_13]OGW40644.1 MAG: hypothetical protein A2X57_03520 [Nitrospirae bacterium GWD2_57_8]
MSLVGRLEDLALPDIFQIISLSKKTGTLVVRSRRGTGMVVFRNGQVIQAASDGIRDSLGNILVSQGLIDQGALTKGLAQQRKEPDKPIGMILSEMGAVPAQTIETFIRKQIEEIVYELLSWDEGFFNFELGEIAPKDKIEIDTQEFLLRSGISAEYLLMEGTRILDERKKDQPREAPAPKRQQPVAAPPPAPPPPVTTHHSYEPAVAEFRERIEKEEPRSGITALKSMFNELRFPTATAEVTLLILRYASEVVNRAILFMVKRDEVRGLGQFGIELKGASADQVVRNIRIPLDCPSFFSTVVETRQTYVGPLEENDTHTAMIKTLGGDRPDEIMAIPLIVDGKIALVVYGDNLPDKKQLRDVDTLEIFMSQAGMALEKALLEKKIAELQKERE